MVMPQQGDIIFIDAEPHAGHEEGGHSPASGNIRRPLVVLSNDGYNRNTKMIVGMPITSRILSDERLYVQVIEPKSGIKGSVITFMIPNYDYVARHGEIVGKVKASMLNELLTRAKSVF